jgi:mannose-6-phosphate isomerase-like protein (cupin superfamily)
MTEGKSMTEDTSTTERADVAAMADPRDGIFTQERPWGQFQQFVSNQTVTVKIITVEPGHRLSLQTHDHRGEFWQVLDVPIEVTVGDRTWTAQPGEAVWVPCQAVHRMANQGEQSGRLLEIAYGEFDESDIVRLEDDYARHE